MKIEQFISQLIGVAAVGVFCLLFSGIIFYVLKKTTGIRVDELEETEGLDINEHSMSAYPDFNTKD